MSDDVWYHGTRRGFRGGGYLFPRAWHGSAGTTAPLTPGEKMPDDSDQYVYVTRSLDLAWVYAFHAAGRGRPKVLVVEPSGGLEPDPEHSAAMDAWRTESARVLRVLIEPTMTEEQARSGWVHA